MPAPTPVTAPSEAERRRLADQWPEFRRRRDEELTQPHGWLCLKRKSTRLNSSHL